jgi:hypothetical protein
MADNAVEVLRGSWPDWEPEDADPEVVLIEAIAPMAAEVESMAAQMPKEALITAGQQLWQIPYSPGSPAQTTVTFGFVDSLGYTVPAGRQVNIDGYAFALLNDAVCPNGQTTLAGVPVASADYTASANDLTGQICMALDLPPFVISISVDTPTSDGTDPMDEDSYVQLVIAKQQLRADTLITARDFATEATMQPGIGFAWATQAGTRQVTVVVADPSGEPVPASVKTALNAIYSDPSVRSVNVTFSITDPTYTVVNVTWAVTASGTQPVDAAALQVAVNNVLTQLLSPASSVKDASGMIYQNVLITRVGQLEGVGRVETMTLSTPTTGASVNANGDVVMAGGIAALPQPGTFTGTVDS